MKFTMYAGQVYTAEARDTSEWFPILDTYIIERKKEALKCRHNMVLLSSHTMQ